VEQRELSAKLENTKWRRLWTEKVEKTHEAVAEKQSYIQANEKRQVLKSKYGTAEAEFEAAMRQIADVKHELSRLSSWPTTEEGILAKLEEDFHDERETVAKLELEVEQEAARQRNEERRLEIGTTRLKTAKVELGKELELLKIREEAAQQMLEVHEISLSVAQKRLDDLVAREAKPGSS
jgi:hypothetical protein